MTRVCFRLPHGVNADLLAGFTKVAEMAAVPRAGDTIEGPDGGTYVVARVVWHPFDPEELAGHDVYIVLGRP
jgi:hypothetical protein